MKKMRWFAINGALAAAMWFGLYEGVQGALNVALFSTWVIGIVGLLSNSDRVVNASVDSLATRSMPKPVDTARDLAIVAAFTWYGYWWTAVVFFLGVASMELARNKALKLRDERAKERT